MNYIVYIIHSKDFDKYYIGQTSRIDIRLIQNNEERKSYTSKYRPWKLVFEKKCDSRKEALKLEKYLKSFKNKDRIKEYIAGWRSSTSGGS